jgi:uncharacterized membrane protein YheB (UPF0754 family)
LFGSPVAFLRAPFQSEYATRAELYKFVDDELTAISSIIERANQNEAYHRVDQAAAWMLQAKLYMNAKVYIGSDNHAAVPLITKITGSNYALHTNYNELFLADNDKNGAQNEFIFAIAFDVSTHKLMVEQLS